MSCCVVLLLLITFLLHTKLISCLSYEKFTEEVQVNLPASEQTVQEPKKYTGSAIPSRSFRILQAMTTPEAIGKSLPFSY